MTAMVSLDASTLGISLGLAAVTLLTRGFFLLPERDLPLPAWLHRGFRYAPLAALAAVVAPEIVLHQGHLVSTWKDPRLFAAVVAGAWFAWRRDVLGTMTAGMVVLLALRLGLGW